MSIINEALKKAVLEKQSTPIPSSRETIKRKLDMEFHPKKKSIGWGPVFVVLIGILIAGPIVAPLFATSFKSGQGSLPPQKEASTARKSQFGMEESSLFSALSGPAMRQPFNLSGIVFSPKEAYCIVNGKILKVGESVEGATLTKISPKGIQLEFQGEKIEVLATD